MSPTNPCEWLKSEWYSQISTASQSGSTAKEFLTERKNRFLRAWNSDLKFVRRTCRGSGTIVYPSRRLQNSDTDGAAACHLEGDARRGMVIGRATACR